MANMKPWHEYFFCLANVASMKSKDPSTRVGCVIVNPDNTVASLGFNGFPRGVREDYPERWERDLKYKYVVHAEVNAILSARRSLEGCSLYIAWCPCNECAKAIIQAGIKKVFVNSKSPEFGNQTLQERWKEPMYIAKTMFEEAGVEYVEV